MANCEKLKWDKASRDPQAIKVIKVGLELTKQALSEEVD